MASASAAATSAAGTAAATAGKACSLRATLAAPTTVVQGVGLHTGVTGTVQMYPAAAGSGRVFRLKDEECEIEIKAQVEAVCSRSQLCTTLTAAAEQGNEQDKNVMRKLATVEHLLSAAAGLGLTDVDIHVSGPGGIGGRCRWDATDLIWWHRDCPVLAALPSGSLKRENRAMRNFPKLPLMTTEIPLLDGSASGWVDIIQSAGIEFFADSPPALLPIDEPIIVTHPHDPNSAVYAFPSPYPIFSVGIEFLSLPAIGRQWESWSPVEDSNGISQNSRGLYGAKVYETDIAPARTFVDAAAIDFLRSAGLIKGGSLENALVCDKEKGWLNPPTRFDNEPARHKLLDMIGDIALLPAMPMAHIIGYRSGHALHTELAKKILCHWQRNGTQVP